METITTYQCSICKLNYEKEQDALDCEKRGRPPTDIPVGLIIEPLAAGTNEDRGGVLLGIIEVQPRGHVVSVSYVSTADIHTGTNVDSVCQLSALDTIGHTSHYEFDNEHRLPPAPVRRGTQRLARLIAFMRFYGLIPLLWDGTSYTHTVAHRATYRTGQ